MASISVLGLGLMGKTLAKVLADAGVTTTVWNRTHRDFSDLNAKVAATAAEAIRASDMTIICIADYAGITDLLSDSEVSAAVSGSTIVNLTTGTPPEAIAMGAAIAALGGKYLDGIIAAYPSGIGDADCAIVYAGSSKLWDECAPTLLHLGAASFYVGEALGAPASMDIAIVIHFYHLAYGAFIEAAKYAQANGVSMADVVRLTRPLIGILEESAELAERQIASGDYTTTDATVDVHLHALKLAHEAMGSASTMMPPLIKLFERAHDAGLGDQAFASISTQVRV
jgi:3-hydroxyisobutyrate dehydrogenase-like beta-hydroxyacid dehydrogenase